MAITLRSKSAQAFVKEMVHENWKTMREERSVLEQTWKRCLMAYLCEFDKAWVDYAKKAGRSHRYVAISWDSVETITPQIYDTIFGSENSLKVRPIREGGMSESDDDLATQMRYLLRHQMMYGKYQRTAQMAIKQMLILGNCPWTMAWKTIKAPDYGHFTDAMKRWMEQAAAHQAEFNDLTATYQAVALRAQLLGAEPPPPPEIAPPPAPPRELDTIFAGPVLRIGSIFNYVQEQHPNDDIGSIRVMRSFRTLQYLKALAKPDPKTGYVLYENLDLVKPDRSEEGTGDNDAEILMKMAVGMTLPHGKDKIEVKEQHGTIEIPSGPDAGLYENYVAVTFNDELVRLEPSPLFSNKPLVQNARLTIFEGAVYGVGIIEKSLSEQDTVNAVHNQNIDATNSVIQPEYEVVEENLAEPMKPSGPGARHKVQQAGTITAIVKNYSGIPIGVEAVRESIMRHERITGAVNTAPSVDETATRTARNSNVIATKLGGHVEAVELELVNESLNIAMEMNAQYLDDDVVIGVTQDGKNHTLTISPQAIRRGWMVYSAGSKYMAERDQRIQNLMMAKQMASQDAATGAPTTVNMVELDRRLYKEILGDAENIVKPKEQFEQEMQQYQQMQAQMQMAAAQAEGGVGGGATGTQGAAPASSGGAPAGTPGAPVPMA
jgi:hypothetical protein